VPYSPTIQQLIKYIELSFSKGAKNTAFLTESISNSETIKSMALERVMLKRWNKQTLLNFVSNKLHKGKFIPGGYWRYLFITTRVEIHSPKLFCIITFTLSSNFKAFLFTDVDDFDMMH
jgi:hypothetical protein